MRRAPVVGAMFLLGVSCNPSTTKPGITNDAPTTITSTASVSSSRPASSTAPAGAHVEVIEASRDSDALSLVRTKRLEAKAEGRVLVVYAGASWCEPCKKFKLEVQSGRLDERLGKTTLLAFDADKDADRLGAAGYSFKFVPFVALPGADGRPADAHEATGKGGQAWRELLGKLDGWQRAP
jgi:hypothetical protein